MLTRATFLLIFLFRTIYMAIRNIHAVFVRIQKFVLRLYELFF